MDRKSPRELAELIAGENALAVEAAVGAAGSLATAIEWVAEAFMKGGRVIYVGAGTSGRIAAADAAEMPPTFGVDPDRFVAVVAGAAHDRAIEGAEDDRDAAVIDLQQKLKGPDDVVIGLSASGRTPYVLSAIAHAKKIGLHTIGIANNPGSAVLAEAALGVLLDTGPEVLAGSTRLKAGTAQKIALNTLSTGAMVLAGRVAGNVMSHMTPTNTKLRERAAATVASRFGISEEEARKRLEESGWNLPKVLEGTDRPGGE